ncbi:MAG: ion transporter [Actinomycetota bacterium]|nr:ion transporter [Actinomycetota bacterium]
MIGFLPTFAFNSDVFVAVISGLLGTAFGVCAMLIAPSERIQARVSSLRTAARERRRGLGRRRRRDEDVGDVVDDELDDELDAAVHADEVSDVNRTLEATAAQWMAITRARWFERVMIWFVMLAAVLVGVESYESFAAQHSALLGMLDVVIVTVFVLEIIARMLAEGAHPWRFFSHPWNVFDLFLVVAALGPMAAGWLGLLRLVRLMRVARVVRAMPKLRSLIAMTVNSIPGILSISTLLLLMFYVYAVAGVFLFSANDPVHFRNLHTSAVTLFQVITLEDWTDVMYTSIYGCDNYGYGDYPELCTAPTDFGAFGAIFFISFVFNGAWILLSLFIGVILTGMDEANRQLEEYAPVDEEPGWLDRTVLGWVREAAIGPTSYNGDQGAGEVARKMKKPVVPNHLPLISGSMHETIPVERVHLEDLERELGELTTIVTDLRRAQAAAIGKGNGNGASGELQNAPPPKARSKPI